MTTTPHPTGENGRIPTRFNMNGLAPLTAYQSNNYTNGRLIPHIGLAKGWRKQIYGSVFLIPLENGRAASAPSRNSTFGSCLSSVRWATSTWYASFRECFAMRPRKGKNIDSDACLRQNSAKFSCQRAPPSSGVSLKGDMTKLSQEAQGWWWWHRSWSFPTANHSGWTHNREPPSIWVNVPF